MKFSQGYEFVAQFGVVGDGRAYLVRQVRNHTAFKERRMSRNALNGVLEQTAQGKNAGVGGDPDTESDYNVSSSLRVPDCVQGCRCR